MLKCHQYNPNAKAKFTMVIWSGILKNKDNACNEDERGYKCVSKYQYFVKGFNFAMFANNLKRQSFCDTCLGGMKVFDDTCSLHHGPYTDNHMCLWIEDSTPRTQTGCPIPLSFPYHEHLVGIVPQVLPWVSTSGSVIQGEIMRSF